MAENVTPTISPFATNAYSAADVTGVFGNLLESHAGEPMPKEGVARQRKFTSRQIRLLKEFAGKHKLLAQNQPASALTSTTIYTAPKATAAPAKLVPDINDINDEIQHQASQQINHYGQQSQNQQSYQQQQHQQPSLQQNYRGYDPRSDPRYANNRYYMVESIDNYPNDGSAYLQSFIQSSHPNAPIQPAPHSQSAPLPSRLITGGDSLLTYSHFPLKAAQQPQRQIVDYMPPQDVSGAAPSWASHLWDTSTHLHRQIQEPHSSSLEGPRQTTTSPGSATSSPCPSDPSLYRTYLCHILNFRSEDTIDLTAYIDRGTLIAKGGFGDIYKGKWNKFLELYPHIQESGLPDVAVKLVNLPILDSEKKKKKRLKNIKRELELWSKLRHENVLPLVGFACINGDSNMPAFISPWMKDGSVMNFLEKNPNFPALGFIRDTITGLHYLHTFDPEIVHGDMKASNVLVSHWGRAYLCDFGLSRFVVENTLWNTTATHANGTLRWMAPELLDGEE